MKNILIFACWLLAFTKPFSGLGQKLNYTVYVAGKNVGKLNAFCTRGESNTFYIRLETRIHLPFKDIVSLIETRYAGNELVSSSSQKHINGTLKELITVVRQQNTYHLVNSLDKINTFFPAPIDFSVGKLYHFMPHGLNKIFSERLGAFIPIKETKEGVFELTQPDGNKNVFTYKYGICTGMQTEMFAFNVRFQLSE
jgi:hypothetical protein